MTATKAAQKPIRNSRIVSTSSIPPLIRIAFQGERGAYGEEAVAQYFGEAATPLPQASFAAVFDAVRAGEAQGGLVPIENSQAGSVHEVYDLLGRGEVFVTGEICLPVNHCLLALPGQSLSAIRRVESHPQALAQCDQFLRGLGMEVLATYDTAGSAKAIREEQRLGVAAVASARAAAIYHLDILARNIQTIQQNYTRFIAIHRQPAQPHQRDALTVANAKTMLLLATPHQPGALYRALGVFARRGINLLKLESRPSRQKPWEYIFYLDVEDVADQQPLAGALKALKKSATSLQVFGSFARSPEC